jgi:hypothetical protein
VVSKGFVRMCIKLAGARVPLNRGVELLRVEGLEPRTKPRQLARGELFDGFLDVFGSGHAWSVSSASGDAKTACRGGRPNNCMLG